MQNSPEDDKKGVKLDIKKFSPKIKKGTELNRCKKYRDKIPEQV